MFVINKIKHQKVLCIANTLKLLFSFIINSLHILPITLRRCIAFFHPIIGLPSFYWTIWCSLYLTASMSILLIIIPFIISFSLWVHLKRGPSYPWKLTVIIVFMLLKFMVSYSFKNVKKCLSQLDDKLLECYRLCFCFLLQQ